MQLQDRVAMRNAQNKSIMRMPLGMDIVFIGLHSDSNLRILLKDTHKVLDSEWWMVETVLQKKAWKDSCARGGLWPRDLEKLWFSHCPAKGEFLMFCLPDYTKAAYQN